MRAEERYWSAVGTKFSNLFFVFVSKGYDKFMLTYLGNYFSFRKRVMQKLYEKRFT